MLIATLRLPPTHSSRLLQCSCWSAAMATGQIWFWNGEIACDCNCNWSQMQPSFPYIVVCSKKSTWVGWSTCPIGQIVFTGLWHYEHGQHSIALHWDIWCTQLWSPSCLIGLVCLGLSKVSLPCYHVCCKYVVHSAANYWDTGSFYHFYLFCASHSLLGF